MSCYFSRGWEMSRKTQSGQSVAKSRFQPWNSRTRSRTANHSTSIIITSTTYSMWREKTFLMCMFSADPPLPLSNYILHRSKHAQKKKTSFNSGIIFQKLTFFQPVNNFTAFCPKTRFIKCHMTASPDYICHMRRIHTLARPQPVSLR